METFNNAIDGFLKLLIGWAPPVLGLTLLSAVIGVAMLWVVGKTSNQARMKEVKRKVYAALLELRVFADEPAVTWRAQKMLFASNMRYMGLALVPALWASSHSPSKPSVRRYRPRSRCWAKSSASPRFRRTSSKS